MEKKKMEACAGVMLKVIETGIKINQTVGKKIGDEVRFYDGLSLIGDKVVSKVAKHLNIPENEAWEIISHLETGKKINVHKRFVKTATGGFNEKDCYLYNSTYKGNKKTTFIDEILGTIE